MINLSRSYSLIELNGKRGFNTRERGTNLICRGSKTRKGTVAEVYCYGTRRKVSFILRQYTLVFQAEVYAIKACAVKNLDRNYKNMNI
jgi:hypothetical protein